MLEPLNTSERAILDALLDIDGATVQEVRQRFLPSDLVAVLSPSGGWRTRANFIKAVSSLHQRGFIGFPTQVGELPVKGTKKYIVPPADARIELTDHGWDVVLGE